MDGAIATAERIRAAVAGLGARLLDPDWRGITVSIGVATLPVHAQGAEELATQADQALYRAKARGRLLAVYCAC